MPKVCIIVMRGSGLLLFDAVGKTIEETPPLVKFVPPK
jgi:hypothetical protein